MYFLDGVHFPFEVFVENINEEDMIYQILSQVDCSFISKHFQYKGFGCRGLIKTAVFRALILKHDIREQHDLDSSLHIDIIEKNLEKEKHSFI